MGKYFSDAVDQALEDIYYCYDAQRAAAALQPLTAAAAAGDGDASYLLFRCACGPDYSWSFHPFQEDENAAYRYLRGSVLQGSAMGVLGAIRIGMLTPELEEAARARFPSLKDAWNAVYEKAEAGCLFAMNLIGSGYYWLDIARIEGKNADSFPSQKECDAWLRENVLKSVPWFEKAFRGGMGVAGRNWYNLYHQGQEGLIPPDRKRAEEIAKMGAELGYPDWQEIYGNWIKDEPGQGEKAAQLFRSAAGQGQLSAWFYLGMLYYEGTYIPQDRRKALECFDASASRSINGACMAGVLYYTGEGGVQDYARAVQLLEGAKAKGADYGIDMLADCYLFGRGCQRDPGRAYQLFQEWKYNTDIKNYGLGAIYTEGLGVPVDIGKGVEYFQKCKGYAPAQEALLHFKKTLFGKWVRR
jgi:hypothetical protein